MPNDLYEEYEKFVGKEVTVRYHEGDKVIEEKGIIKFLNFSYLSLVLMTETEKVIIKNIISIRRKKQGKK